MSRRCIASITLVDLYQEKNTSWVWVAFLKSGDSIEILVQIHKLVACNFYLFLAIVDFIGMILKKLPTCHKLHGIFVSDNLDVKKYFLSMNISDYCIWYTL